MRTASVKPTTPLAAWSALLALGVALVACGRAPGPTPAPVNQGATQATTQVAPAARPAAWAQPLSRPGLPNLFKVSDHLYRGGQPEDAGFAQLKNMGIKTVICLREFHGDADQCARNGLKYVPIPMVTWDADDPKVALFLKTVSDKNNWPVFVHCKRGADRTGTCLAVYRVVVEGWTKDQAIDEMARGGYDFDPLWQNLVAYVRKIDAEALRTKAQ